jgi:two-component system chemotaxis response regulator CheY
MPDLNGPQVMTKIRQWEKTKGVALSDAVKIIMMSADSSKEAIKTALKEGCEAFLVKPINREKLARAFRQVHYI